MRIDWLRFLRRGFFRTRRVRRTARRRRRESLPVAAEVLEERTLLSAPTVTYVDAASDFHLVADADGSGGVSNGDTVDFLPGTASEVDNLLFGTNAFDTIQGGVNAVDAGGTVHVCPGDV